MSRSIQPKPTLPLRGQTILIVEDEALIALDLCNEIKAAGAHVMGAAAPGQALKILEELQPSASVVDFRLGADGASSVVQKLKQRGVPFLFYTGYLTNSADHAAPIIEKPGRPGAVLTALIKLIAAHSAGCLPPSHSVLHPE